jgi:uncharacterized protein YwgA
MTRRDLVLAALSPAKGGWHTPVQVQKLLFLLERQRPEIVNEGDHFHFAPYHYGPFDKGVYEVLEALCTSGLVQAQATGPWRSFALTEDGQQLGTELLGQLDIPTREFIEKTSAFVRSQSFSGLVSAIYKAFPDMKVNSVFR